MKKACLSPSNIEDRLERAGIRPTAQRLAICRYVLCEADHPSAEQVKEWADAHFPKISLATVYNTLGVLVSAGLLQEVNLPDCASVLYDNNLDGHYHFFDEETGRIEDIATDKVKVHANLGKKYRLRGVGVILRGTKV